MPRRQEPDRRCPFPGPDHQHPLPALGPVWTPIGKPCRDVTLAVCVCPHTRGPAFVSSWISDMRAILGIAVGAFVLGSSAVAIGDSPEARRVTGTVMRVHCPSGHVSVRAEGRDVDRELRRAGAGHLKAGDRIAVWLPRPAAPQAPKWP